MFYYNFDQDVPEGNSKLEELVLLFLLPYTVCYFTCCIP